MTTTITSTPVRYTSFLSVELEVKPSVPNALPSMLTVSNPPPEKHSFLQNRTLAAASAVSGSLPASAAPSSDATADAGDWKHFVDHLQQQGQVPGAAADDPERGVVTPANISVKQMLAFLRNQPPAKPAWIETPVRQQITSTPSRVTTAPIPPAPVAASAKPDAASSVMLRQDVDAAVADDQWGTAALLEEMEQLHEAADPRLEPAPAQLLDDDQALDEELRMWEQTYRPHSGELHTVYEEDENDQPDLSKGFGTTPRAELADLRRAAMVRGNAALVDDAAEHAMDAQGRLRSVTFNDIGTSRVHEVDAESGETVSVRDQLFLSKEHDGKWKRNQLQLQLLPEQLSHTPESRRSPSAVAAPAVLDAADDSGFAVHSPYHGDRYHAPTHADHGIGETVWSDMGRDDEPAAIFQTTAARRLQQLQQLQHQLDASLRRNQQMSEEVGVYF